ncbi:MAG: hypothetical protein NTV74_03255, partial [Euryarchaeota archaeon]|nr:hypothetical protein [Euryarchaeota archaeon]
EFANYKELEQKYLGGLHPLDLKNSTASYINPILVPVHVYFEKHPENYSKINKLEIIKSNSLGGFGGILLKSSTIFLDCRLISATSFGTKR